MNLTELFRPEPIDLLERAAMADGASIMEEADKLIALYAASDRDPHERAAKSARGWALYLSGVLPNARGSTAAERAGMKLQSAWWHAVADEINERSVA